MRTVVSWCLLILMIVAAEAPAAGAGSDPKVTAHLEQGQTLFRKRDLEGALAAFTQAERLAPRNAQAPYFRGVVWDALGKPRDAEAAYRRAIALDPGFSEAHNNLGSLLFAAGRHRDAEQSFQAAIKARPGHTGAHFNLGVLYDHENRHTDAVAAYRQAVASQEASMDAPLDASARAPLLLNLGAAMRRAGDLDGAIAQLTQAHKLMPQDPVVATNLGLVLSDRQLYDQARDVLLRATKADAGHAPAWHALGRVHMRRKDVAGALAAMRRAAERDRNDPTIAEDACRAELAVDATGKTTLGVCQRAVQLAPEAPLARYSLAKALVARGDCAAAHQEIERFNRLPGVSDRARKGAAALLQACGKPHK